MTFKELEERKTPLPEKTIFVSTPLHETDTIYDIFSNSLDHDKAPLLFTSARLQEIEQMAIAGETSAVDTLWLIQENRKYAEELVKIENKIKKSILRIEEGMRE